uniref:Uncharacterized protein n=1 Tax=Cacopsylla melanoneura TaxID=428564 RepID=A0A8D8M7W3_9HEMI
MIVIFETFAFIYCCIGCNGSCSTWDIICQFFQHTIIKVTFDAFAFISCIGCNRSWSTCGIVCQGPYVFAFPRTVIIIFDALVFVFRSIGCKRSCSACGIVCQMPHVFIFEHSIIIIIVILDTLAFVSFIGCQRSCSTCGIVCHMTHDSTFTHTIITDWTIILASFASIPCRTGWTRN